MWLTTDIAHASQCHLKLMCKSAILQDIRKVQRHVLYLDRWALRKEMKRIIKILVLSITCLYVLNLMTLLMFGKTSLIKKIVQNTHTSYKEFR